MMMCFLAAAIIFMFGAACMGCGAPFRGILAIILSIGLIFYPYWSHSADRRAALSEQELGCLWFSLGTFILGFGLGSLFSIYWLKMEKQNV
jgi:hypothetical protein